MGIHADQDSANFCASYAAPYHFVLYTWWFWDQFHRVHNDIYDAIGDIKMKAVVLLATILFNLSWGPWTGCAWFEVMKEQVLSFVTIGDENNAVFNYHYDDMATDQPGYSESLSSTLP